MFASCNIISSSGFNVICVNGSKLNDTVLSNNNFSFVQCFEQTDSMTEFPVKEAY